jgi:uncharacterized membrane protein YcaP (DUF421 family)
MIYDVLSIFLRAFVCVAAIIALTRINGLRSFSKMSSFDFAITVACGSVLASAIISPKETLWFGITALVALFTVQGAIAWGRAHFAPVRDVFDNTPVLIMKDGEILADNLKSTGMTEADLYGKLREANAFDLRRVRAVVFEPTGDVSVLHGRKGSDDEISEAVMRGVRQ